MLANIVAKKVRESSVKLGLLLEIKYLSSSYFFVWGLKNLFKNW